MKRTFCILLAALVLFSLPSCSFKEDEGETGEQARLLTSEESKTMRLSYYSSDSLNPFTCKTKVNSRLMTLCYDGLYTLDTSLKPQPCIAESSIVSGSRINVSLSVCAFSDGTRITANDVVLSFENAKESDRFSTSLSNFDTCTASSQSVVIFTLTEPDPYALSLLTFPIIKSGSCADMAVGAGRYSFSRTDNGIFLNANIHSVGFEPNIKTIELTALRSEEQMVSNLEIGNTAVYFDDLSSGVYERKKAQTVEVTLNSLVFLGMNCNNSIFSNESVRRAVNLSLDRSEITTKAFQNHAVSCFTPFRPDWYEISSMDFTVKKNTAEAKLILEESGVDITERSVTLLVNKENPFKTEAASYIKESLEEVGFEVEVKEYTPEYFEEMLKLGGFDLYIGEISLLNNMSLDAFFEEGEIPGVDTEGESAVAYKKLRNSELSLMDFINTFNEDMPFTPLCCRTGVASYANLIKASFNISSNDIFFDIENWVIS